MKWTNKRIDGLVVLLGIVALLLCSCSPNLTGTTEEPNARGLEAPNEIAMESSSSFALSSSSVKQGVSTSSEVPRSSSNPNSSDTSYCSYSSSFSEVLDTVPVASSSSVWYSSSSFTYAVSSATFSASSSSVPYDPPPEPIPPYSSERHAFGNPEYWYPYWIDHGVDRASMEVESDERFGVTVSFEVPQHGAGGWGGGFPSSPAPFGVAIRVEGDDSLVFAEMKTWTHGICFVLLADAPVSLKMGLSPEKERELMDNVPQVEVVSRAEAEQGDLVTDCKRWSEFRQRIPAMAEITGEDVFEQMITLKFEVNPVRYNQQGELYIFDLYAYDEEFDPSVDSTATAAGSGGN